MQDVFEEWIQLANFHTEYYPRISLGQSMEPTMPYANFCSAYSNKPHRQRSGKKT